MDPFQEQPVKSADLIKKWKAEGLDNDEIKRKLAALKKKAGASSKAASPTRKKRAASLVKNDGDDIPPARGRAPIAAPAPQPKTSVIGILGLIFGIAGIGIGAFAMTASSGDINSLRTTLTDLRQELTTAREEAETKNKTVSSTAQAIDSRLKTVEGNISEAMESRVSTEDIPRILTEHRYKVIDKAKRSVVYVGTPQGTGSGFFVDLDGRLLILTNTHVVGDFKEVTIMTWEEKWASCLVIARDPATDIAILEVMSVERGNLKDDKGQMPPAAELMDSDTLRVGDRCFAMGAPHGLVKTVNAGQVSNTRRYLDGLPIMDKVSGLYNTYFQIDCGVMPGNSGGPTFNDKGQVIGINTRANHTNEAEGFVMPINFVMERAENMLASGDKKNHYNTIGFDIDPWFRRQHETADIKILPSNQDSGLIVKRVFEDSPAHESGFRSGDVILKINGKKVEMKTEADIIEIRREIAFGSPGTEYTFEVKTFPVFDPKTGEKTKDSERRDPITLRVLDDETYRLPIPLPMLMCYINSLEDDAVPEDWPGGVRIVDGFNPTDFGFHLRGQIPPVRFPIQKGDIIVQVNEEKVRHPGELTRVIKELELVRQFPQKILIVRDEELMTFHSGRNN